MHTHPNGAKRLIQLLQLALKMRVPPPNPLQHRPLVLCIRSGVVKTIRRAERQRHRQLLEAARSRYQALSY